MRRILIAACLLVLCSCNGSTSVTRTIDNQSDSEVHFFIYHFGYPTGDTIKILAGQSRVLSRGSSDTAEETADCTPRLDSAYTKVVLGGTLMKNIALKSNWDSESEKTKSFPPEYEHNCSFVIRDADIEL